MTYGTEQERFWAGEFGAEYMARNRGPELVAANTALFARVLRRAQPIRSVIEFGANIGLNLIALRTLLPSAELAGVEINEGAARELERIPDVTVFPTSIMDFRAERKWDLVFTKGVLIHIDPDELENVYRRMYEAAERYICITEYYNPTPVEVPYRGHRNRLFKRDFAGGLLDLFPDLTLIDYGFSYHRDPGFRQDDLTWFLLERSVAAEAAETGRARPS